MMALYLGRRVFSSLRRHRMFFACLAVLGLCLLAAGTLVFRYRHDLSDAWRKWQVGRIEAVSERQPSVVFEPVTSSAAIFLQDASASDEAPLPDAPVSGVAPLPASPLKGGGDLSGESEVESVSVLPDRLSLPVPMVYQSPFSVWDARDEDACEEASMLMVIGFLDGRESYTRQEMDDGIDALVDYEMEAFGRFESTTAEEVVRVMREHLGLAGVVIKSVGSIDDIRRELAAGRPVILPLDGRTLKNPNFRNGGPTYHMLVVKGYTKTQLITNDPGTRRGESWLYDNGVIMASLADWVQDGLSVDHGRKVMIVVE